MHHASQQGTVIEAPVIDSELENLLRDVLALEVDPFDKDETDAIIEEAQAGNAAAQYIVGVALESLDPPRLSDALAWYRLASEQNYLPAREKYHLLLIN